MSGDRGAANELVQRRFLVQGYPRAARPGLPSSIGARTVTIDHRCGVNLRFIGMS